MTPQSDVNAENTSMTGRVESASSRAGAATIDYCGDEYVVDPDKSMTIGREAELVIDDNEFLHRVFLVLSQQDGYWFLHNVGTQLGATVFESAGRMEAFLAPGASLPLVFPTTNVVFTAGPTTYEFSISVEESAYSAPAIELDDGSGNTTVGAVSLTRDQRLLILALCESSLRRDGRVATNLPSSPQAAARLGWTTTKFNRKLDNVCDKLSKLGVRGLQGDLASYASNRRGRLVEYALATRLVVPADLELFDAYLEKGSSE